MSRKGYFETTRQLRKMDLLAVVTKTPGLPKEKLMGLFSLRTGLTFRKIEMYIEELEAAGLLEVNDAGEVSPVKGKEGK